MLHLLAPLPFETTNAPFHLNMVSYMHFVVCINNINVGVRLKLQNSNPPHDEVFLSNITRITKKILKVLVFMSKTMPPIVINIIVPQNFDIMETLRVSNVKMNEQSIVINHHNIFHCIYFLPTIESPSTLNIVKRPSDLDQSPIYHPYTARKLENFGGKLSLQLNVGHLISSEMDTLMHNAASNASSHIKPGFQFHVNASYLTILSCFM